MTPEPGPETTQTEPPGVPGFRTWRAVYLFVFVAFLLMVAGLTLFARVYA